MKNIHALFLTFFVLNMTYAHLNMQNPSSSDTDTIHKILSDFQCDSLVKANNSNPHFYILDLNTPGEYYEGHLASSHNLNFFDAEFDTLLENLDRDLIYLIYCKAGKRSLPTYNKMIKMDFRELYLMNGGFNQWKSDGLPYETGVVSEAERTFTPEKNINIYPVYSNSELNIELIHPSRESTLIILNTNGLELLRVQLTGSNSRIDIRSLHAGVYLVKVNGINSYYTHKFVKE